MCGNVQYGSEVEPMAQAVCHCTDRQKQTGSAFSIVIGLHEADLTIGPQSRHGRN